MVSEKNTGIENRAFEDVLRGRSSVRGFLPTPLSAEKLRQIFELAQRSPSNCNTQPWRVCVVSGRVCQSLRDRLYELASSDQEPNPDFKIQHAYDGVFRQRQVDCATALYDSMGVQRGDKSQRKAAMLRNFEFFQAPHAAFISMPKRFGVFNALDVGMYLQTLLLCMKSYGVASCAQGALALYPDAVREVTGIADDQGILVGVAFGYEDPDHVTSNTVTSRADLGDIVTFLND